MTAVSPGADPRPSASICDSRTSQRGSRPDKMRHETPICCTCAIGCVILPSSNLQKNSNDRNVLARRSLFKSLQLCLWTLPPDKSVLVSTFYGLKRFAFNLRYQLKAKRVQRMSGARRFAKICDSGFSRNALSKPPPFGIFQPVQLRV